MLLGWAEQGYFIGYRVGFISSQVNGRGGTSLKTIIWANIASRRYIAICLLRAYFARIAFRAVIRMRPVCLHRLIGR